MTERKKKHVSSPARVGAGYETILADVAGLLEAARRTSARAVNAVMTATYWEVGRRIVEFEQGGAERAGYGKKLIERLSVDLGRRFGRGFGVVNLTQMRRFYQLWTKPRILQTASEHLVRIAQVGDVPTLSDASMNETSSKMSPILQPASEESDVEKRAAKSLELSTAALARAFPRPWSHYVKLLSVDNENARAFYETETLRGGWTVRQLNRQINTQFYERTALSRNKAALLKQGGQRKTADAVSPEEELKDPLILEFLGLKDEYSEGELEEALIRQLESFLLELGSDFAFVGRQRRLRIGDEWYRIDLLFFHRRLRCVVVIDLKLGRFTHADAGQMHLYLNYAREHWTHADENPPVALILCAQKDAAVAHYALAGLPNKVLAAEYRTALPAERTLAEEIDRTRRLLEDRGGVPKKRRRRTTGLKS
jgi:predicted nuclease of restriction endonuclease-like (RecB) superfamily